MAFIPKTGIFDPPKAILPEKRGRKLSYRPNSDRTRGFWESACRFPDSKNISCPFTEHHWLYSSVFPKFKTITTILGATAGVVR
jgi:hypothetical protein